MALDVSLGNITQDEADRLSGAVWSPDSVPHEPGSTEPWVSQLVANFIVARGARTVLETGTFKGATTVWIVNALAALGGGQLHICEIDKEHHAATVFRAATLMSRLGNKVEIVCHESAVSHLCAQNAVPRVRYDLAFIDDEHTKRHVERELTLLYPLMNPGGLILLHDVVGSCDLRTVVAKFGGYSLDLPRLGPAGGLGIIQVP